MKRMKWNERARVETRVERAWTRERGETRDRSLWTVARAWGVDGGMDDAGMDGRIDGRISRGLGTGLAGGRATGGNGRWVDGWMDGWMDGWTRAKRLTARDGCMFWKRTQAAPSRRWRRIRRMRVVPSEGGATLRFVQAVGGSG